MATEPKAKATIRQGTVFGTWTLGKLINRGGQGEVWEVRPTSRVRTPPRAMKICTASDGQSRERFQREVSLLQNINHPNVVPVLESDLSWSLHEKSGLECAYYVTERFDSSLEELKWIHDAPIALLKLFRDLCGAIEHLHGQSAPIVHRDLKPSNILFGSEPRRIAVTDLGIAYVPTEESALTRMHEVVGTQHYRAPETSLGSRGDERSDIYSLGGHWNGF